MRNRILYPLVTLALMLGMSACTEEDKYETSVVKQIELFLNDEPWSVNTGASNKPLFIYKENGDYFANYSSLYRFQLPNGKYKVISTTDTDSIPQAVNLNDIVVKQGLDGKAKFAVSAPVEYNSPFNEPLAAHMYSKTGVLRLRATDKKGDKSYSIIRAVISTPVSGYKLSDATLVKAPVDVTRYKATTTGGVNYTDDFVLFETESIAEAVSVRIDYLDKDSALVQSKAIDGTFSILPNDTTQIAFALNNENEPIIQNYIITIASEGWTEEDLNPEAPMKIPAGYTYVSPEENLQTICGNMMADPAVTEVKLFLKAGGTYTLGRQTDIPKGLSIMAEMPRDGEAFTTMEMGNMSISNADATIETIHFENLNIKVTDSDFFKFKNQAFHVGEISLKNCEIHDLVRTMWYQEVDGARKQVVDNLLIEDCRFFGLNHPKSGFIGLSTKQDAPVHNIVFRNSTFHALDLTKALITGLSAMTGDLSITIENCTFVGMGPAGMIFFDLAPKNTDNFTLSVKNNLFSGVSTEGSGKWFNLNKVTNRTFTGNYHTQGFVLGTWGVEDSELPIETASMNALFTDVENRDLTIKDKTSTVYINRVGDPHWIE